jgi:hypothetical protein
VRFEWIENFSIHALSNLIRKRAKFNFIFIDGNHRFDDVIVDFYLSDQILQPGGLVVFDDMWLNSVRTATNFILNNRSYEVVPQPFENMLVLRKTRYDNRDSTEIRPISILLKYLALLKSHRRARRLYRTVSCASVAFSVKSHDRAAGNGR